MIDEATELSRVLKLPIPQVNPDPFFFLFPFASSFNRLESHSREGKGTTQDLWPNRGASHQLAILHWARAEKARVSRSIPEKGLTVFLREGVFTPTHTPTTRTTYSVNVCYFWYCFSIQGCLSYLSFLFCGHTASH